MSSDDAHELLTQIDNIRGKYPDPTERAKVKRSLVEAMIKKVSICKTCKQPKTKINTEGYCSC